jgi:hypothetical protein
VGKWCISTLSASPGKWLPFGFWQIAVEVVVVGERWVDGYEARDRGESYEETEVKFGTAFEGMAEGQAFEWDVSSGANREDVEIWEGNADNCCAWGLTSRDRSAVMLFTSNWRNGEMEFGSASWTLSPSSGTWTRGVDGTTSPPFLIWEESRGSEAGKETEHGIEEPTRKLCNSCWYFSNVSMETYKLKFT